MKETLNLPHTDFPMKGDLSRREPEFIKFWEDSNIYQKLIDNRVASPRFVLNDGPPYANGPIHIGHAINKILKDIIIKSKNLEGYQSPYIPGWDCHGLPIEIQVEKKVGRHLSPSDFRSKCRDYAEEQIIIQAEGFKRLGVLADWNNPYKTMNKEFESNIVRQFKALFDKKLVKPGLKPVYWCADCQSSLSDAETEFAPKTSHAIDVMFDFVEPIEINHQKKSASVVIWTTTPWTLPANQAVAYGASIDYVAVEYKERFYIVAKELVESCIQRWGFNESEYMVHSISSNLLNNQMLLHPLYQRVVPLLTGDHVTVDVGTGFVHTAPDHGPEDYELGRQHQLLPLQLIDSKGCYVAGVPDLAGENNFSSDKKVIEILNEKTKLLATKTLEHSYPICWRHKKPIFYRATPQWFVGLSDTFKSEIIEGIHKVQWHPDWGATRMQKMIEQRPDWCISRQRSWGTPVVLIYDKDTYEIHPEMSLIIEEVASAIESKGLEAWFGSNLADWGVTGERWVASKDTLDVWFDSGSVFHILMHKNLQYPADLYLEGVDQYRGWFQSSLICSMGRFGTPPYKGVLTHGFAVDKDGKKMSKSLGNVVSPLDVANKYGIDVLRLWVATSNYTEEMAIGDEILTRTSDIYRRIRNTMRFLLSNLFDITIDNLLPIEKMAIIDKFYLKKTIELQSKARKSYASFDFDTVARSLVDFCVNDLGGDYLDIIKDRLYTAAPNSQARRSCQTTLFYMVDVLIHIMSPILPFTAEDVWQHWPHKKKESILLSVWSDYSKYAEILSSQDEEQSIEIMKLKKDLQPKLESLRQSGVIGSALEAKAIVKAPQGHWIYSWKNELKFIFLVSDVTFEDNNEQELSVLAEALENVHKCQRCWHRVPALNEKECCHRCDMNINSDGEQRIYG